MPSILGPLKPAVPMLAALAIGIAFIWVVRKVFSRILRDKEQATTRLQVITLALSIVLLLVIVLLAPIESDQRAQILNLIGLVLSAALTLSSTTFIGNALAGLMLRVIKGFRLGDFVQVGDHFGRVSERGIFHVEIQTEQRDLVTLPNLIMVTKPVRVVRASGTLIWAEVSLGYDVNHNIVKETLRRAGKKCGLEEPLVTIMNLGDFSVKYRLSGLLKDVKHMITARSRLLECMLDELHHAGIEIVSPSFMNTRQYDFSDKFIPKPYVEHGQDDETAIEEIAFDKAEQAQSAEEARMQLEKLSRIEKKLEERLSEASSQQEREFLSNRRERLRKVTKKLENRLKKFLEQEGKDA